MQGCEVHVVRHGSLAMQTHPEMGNNCSTTHSPTFLIFIPLSEMRGSIVIQVRTRRCSLTLPILCALIKNWKKKRKIIYKGKNFSPNGASVLRIMSRWDLPSWYLAHKIYWKEVEKSAKWGTILSELQMRPTKKIYPYKFSTVWDIIWFHSIYLLGRIKYNYNSSKDKNMRQFHFLGHTYQPFIHSSLISLLNFLYF